MIILTFKLKKFAIFVSVNNSGKMENKILNDIVALLVNANYYTDALNNKRNELVELLHTKLDIEDIEDKELVEKLNRYIIRKSLNTERTYTEMDAYIDIYKLAKFKL